MRSSAREYRITRPRFGRKYWWSRLTTSHHQHHRSQNYDVDHAISLLSEDDRHELSLFPQWMVMSRMNLLGSSTLSAEISKKTKTIQCLSDRLLTNY